MAEGTLGGTKIADLPPSSFAYCEPGSEAVSTRCHFPIRDANGKADAAHVRNALARLSGSPFEAKARPKVEAAAKELGIGEPAGKASELKAEPMNTSHMERWLRGEVPRRILALPFGGPIPSPKTPLGVDLDDEWFDEGTDYIGDYPALKASRERLVDWHHTTGGADLGYTDPIGGLMKGAILGRIVLDDGPDTVDIEGLPYTGIWADWWTKFGDTGRKALIARQEQAKMQMYGSTQPVRYGVSKASDGHIDVWPIQWHTITTYPRNHNAVVPPLKAVLTADLPFDEVGLAALKAALVGLDNLTSDLRLTSEEGEIAAKAGRVLSGANEAELRRAMEALSTVLAKLVKDPEVVLDLIPELSGVT